MNRSRVVGFGVTVLLAVTGCSPSSPGTAATSVATVSKAPRTGQCAAVDPAGTVDIWLSMAGNASYDLWDGFTSAFESETGAHIELRQFDGDTEIIDALASTPIDRWPAIVNVSEQATRTLLDSGRFVAPPACDPNAGSDLLPLVRATYTVDDRLVAMPFAVSAPVLIYDKEKLRRAGLDPDRPPRTLADLLEVSRTVTSTGAAGHGLVLSDWCANIVLEQYSAKRGITEGRPDNGHMTRSIAVNFGTAENIDDLTALRDGVVQGHVQYIGPNPSNFDDLVQLSKPGGATMTIHTSGALGDIIRLADAGNFPGTELGVGPMPGPGLGSLIGGNAFWLVDSGDAERIGRAWSAIEWLERPEHLAELAAATGYVPATTSAAAVPSLLARWQRHPELRIAYDQVQATPVNLATAGMVIGPFEERSRALFGLCDRIMNDGAGIAAALTEASATVNELVMNYEAERAGGAPVVSVTEGPGATGGDTTGGPVAISGEVECASGASVVGVWVEARDGGSGWADRQVKEGGRTRYDFVLPNGGQYQLHVGCGGTDAEWGATNYTPFVANTPMSFRCFDSSGDTQGECEVEAASAAGLRAAEALPAEG